MRSESIFNAQCVERQGCSSGWWMSHDLALRSKVVLLPVPELPVKMDVYFERAETDRLSLTRTESDMFRRSECDDSAVRPTMRNTGF